MAVRLTTSVAMSATTIRRAPSQASFRYRDDRFDRCVGLGDVHGGEVGDEVRIIDGSNHRFQIDYQLDRRRVLLSRSSIVRLKKVKPAHGNAIMENGGR